MSETQTTTGRRLAWTVGVVVGALAVSSLAAYGLMHAVSDALLSSMTARFRKVVEDPGGDFTRYTGLSWPAGATVVSVGDDHGGFHGDGEFHVVFQCDRATLEAWLSASAPWGQDWQTGPIPTDIGLSCAFGGPEVIAESINGGPTVYVAGPGILRSDRVRYAARERCCPSLRWHNGSLLIVDLEENRVWLSVWDM